MIMKEEFNKVSRLGFIFMVIGAIVYALAFVLTIIAMVQGWIDGDWINATIFAVIAFIIPFGIIVFRKFIFLKFVIDDKGLALTYRNEERKRIEWGKISSARMVWEGFAVTGESNVKSCKTTISHNVNHFDTERFCKSIMFHRSKFSEIKIDLSHIRDKRFANLNEQTKEN